MRKIGIIIVLLVSFVTVWGQTVTDADCYEQDQKAVITYSLDQKANIDLQMSLNGAPFQTLDRTSLSGDVGANVRKGKNKKIVWDVLNDCNSLVGDVQFKVVPSESLDDYNKRIQKENYYRTGYPALCRSYYKSVGTWSVSFADMGIAGGVRDREGKAPLYFGIGTFRYKFFEVSLVAFKLELTSAASAYSMNTTYDAPDFYWEPQVDGVWKPAWYDSLTWTDEQGNTHQGWGAYGKGAFTSSGRPTIALDAFSGKTSEETGIYPSELKVYNKDGNAVLTTLPKTGEGVYAGVLCATEGWMNFHVVDEEHNVWYGTDPADKSALSSADGHWNFWIDSDVVGVYDLEVNLVTMRWTHSFNADATEGIRAVDAGAGLPVSWFDLNGRRLMAPARGVMLMKTGRGVRKVSVPTL